MSSSRERPGQRLVVALPPDEASLALLESALGLADRMERELVGLFLEDTSLLAAAGLPFTRIVPRFGGEAADFDVASTERAVRVLVERARRQLAPRAARHRVRWSFEVVRGGLESFALEAGDVLAFGVVSTAVVEQPPPALPCPVLVIGRRGGPVVVVHDGGDAVPLAEHLAAEEKVPLVAIVRDPGTAAELRRRFGAGATIEVIDSDDATTLTSAIRTHRPGLVLVDSCASAPALRAALAAVRPAIGGGRLGQARTEPCRE